MTQKLIIALAQLNLTLGDIAGNSGKIKSAYEMGRQSGADLVVTTELSISGYPVDDLVLRDIYVESCMTHAEKLASEIKGETALLVGLPWKNASNGSARQKPYNASALLRYGKIEQLWFKHDLPTYGVFDDFRVFTAGSKEEGEPFLIKGVRVGVAICEDMWGRDRAAALKRRGAQIIVVPNGSPYESDKHAMRRAVITARIKETALPVAYVNQLGGQDQLVFDGGSFVLDAAGTVKAYAGSFEEKLLLTHWHEQNGVLEPQQSPEIALFMGEEESAYSALLLGLRDYVEKNGFPGVLIGMSGGLDSAFVAALAVDAFGADRVIAVMMPSPYTSQESLDEAALAARLLGCDYRTIPIAPAMETMGHILRPQQHGHDTDIADQNMQARLRGLILMGLSNTYGHMVLATGNKSEMAVGYATLYGDMCGGFAPIKDVYKTLVYRLSRWRNVNRPKGGLGKAGLVIPERIITRAPSAELKPEQKDEDNLPPYDVLDDILQCLIERDLPAHEIVSRGHSVAVVHKVLHMLKRAEYKRQQSPPGSKITTRAFGRERRYPITNKFVG